MNELLNAFLSLRLEGWIVLAAFMLPMSVYFVATLLSAAAERSQERNRLVLVRQKISVALDTEDPPEPDEMAEDARSVVETFPAGSAVRRAVIAVVRARALATPDVQAASDAISAASESRLATVRNIPNLLMLAGLLGTVLGLAGSIGSLVEPIKSAASASDPGTLARALGTTMNVMRGAFGASLWGILLSLASGILFALASRQQEALQDELSAFVHAELVPTTFPRAITSQMERMGRYLRDAGNSFQDIHQKLQDVAGQLESVLGRAGDTLDRSLSNLSETSTQISGVFSSMDKSVNELTEGLQHGVGDLVRAQEDAATSLRSSSRELEQRLGEQATTISRLQETVTGNTERLLQRVQDVGEALGRAGGKFETAGETFRTEQSNYAARLDRNFETLTRVLARGESVPLSPAPQPVSGD